MASLEIRKSKRLEEKNKIKIEAEVGKEAKLKMKLKCQGMRLESEEEFWLRQKEEWEESFNFWHRKEMPPYKIETPETKKARESRERRFERAIAKNSGPFYYHTLEFDLKKNKD